METRIFRIDSCYRDQRAHLFDQLLRGQIVALVVGKQPEEAVALVWLVDELGDLTVSQVENSIIKLRQVCLAFCVRLVPLVFHICSAY